MRFATLLLLAAAVAAGDEWRYPRGDLANTGVSKNRGPLKTPELVWKREEEGEIGTGAALANGRLVYGTGMIVGCRLATSGFVVWDKQVKQPVVSWPSIVNGMAYFGGQDHVHYGVRMKNADEPVSLEAAAGIVANPVVTEDYYLAGATDGFFFAMSPKDGREYWRRQTGPVRHGAAYDRGVAYVINEEGVLYAFGLKKAAELWKFEAKAAPVAAPILAKKEVLLVLPDRVQAVDRKRGLAGKSHETPGIAGAPVLEKTLLHYGTLQGEIVSLDLRTGKELRRVAVAKEAVRTPLILARKVIYGAAGNLLFALAPNTNKILWTFAAEDPFLPPIVADKTLYVGAGRVFYCLR